MKTPKQIKFHGAIYILADDNASWFTKKYKSTIVNVPNGQTVKSVTVQTSEFEGHRYDDFAIQLVQKINKNMKMMLPRKYDELAIEGGMRFKVDWVLPGRLEADDDRQFAYYEYFGTLLHRESLKNVTPTMPLATHEGLWDSMVKVVFASGVPSMKIENNTQRVTTALIGGDNDIQVVLDTSKNGTVKVLVKVKKREPGSA